MQGFASERYTGTAILLHWVIALLVFALIGLGWYMVDIPKGTPERSYFYNLHKSIGLTTLFFILVRVAWRLTHVPPRLPRSLKRWEVAAYLLVALIALHVGGAFKHLLLDRDAVFRRMLPGRG